MSISSFDVIVLGGGLVGAVTALLLSKKGLNIAVVESKKLALTHEKDARTTAMALGSVFILEKAGIWEKLCSHACPIQTIRVFEEGAPFSLNFTKEDRPFHLRHYPHGYMIDNGELRKVLEKALLKTPGITLFDGVHAVTIEKREAFLSVTLSSGEILKASLLIGAEGRHSKSREMLGIPVQTHPYHQTALVALIGHEKPHDHTAFEIFHKLGPLAFLPFHNQDLLFRSAIVWSICDKKAEDLQKLLQDYSLHEAPNSVLEEALFFLFPYLGRLRLLTSPTFYPLSQQKAKTCIEERFALLGDAAHVMHPVAGQGVNLGWRDASVLAELIEKAFSLGLDIGSDTLLTQYKKARAFDQKSMLKVTDGLIRLFEIDQPTLKMLRTFGLGLVERIPPLKRALAKKAMGI